MGEKIVIGPVDRGLRNDRPPFMIDNDSFPTMINAYQWRGRVKRKRGTSFLGRLQRFFNSTITSYNPGTATITLDGTGSGNLLTGFTTLEATGSVVPDTVSIIDTSNADELYTDPAADGILVGSTGGTGTINYATGTFTITGGAGHVVSASFYYNPNLPVMGLEDFLFPSSQYPLCIAFDTTYAYTFQPQVPYTSYSVSFYKNPATGTIPGYTAKTTPTPVNWNGKNYQQFWTTNYQGAMWATNGIQVPFNSSNIGMQFQKPSSATWISGTSMSFVIVGSPLVVGDFVFTSEWTSTTPANATLMNFLTGFVTNVAGTTYTVTFFGAAIPSDTYTGGLLQYLTNSSDTTKDCIRWYDGDPTNGVIPTPILNGVDGWVNFAPPLSNGLYSVAELPQAQYYLVGARMVYPFKDRLLFFGPVVQTSSASSQIYLKDTIIFSQNGTPYYTGNFTTDPTLASTIFTPILVPTNQTATANAWWENQTGFGGYLAAANDQAIISLGVNEDVIIVEFSRSMSRLVYTGTDIFPFSLFGINAEWGTVGTFSSVTMDQGVLSLGNRGFVITGQTTSERVDLQIPDQVFEVGLQNNGAERICSARDFINEWIYYTYVPDIEDDEAITDDIFPSQTLQYNYREQTWAIFNESYTTYGTFRRIGGYTWATVGNEFPTWGDWNEPWNAGVASQLQPEIIAGTSQGFVVFRDQGTSESISRYIQAINTTTGVVTSPGHALDPGDFIIVSNALGTVGAVINEQIYQIGFIDNDTFTINLANGALTYIGNGVFTKMYRPFFQTKQFPVAWGNARKTRLGVQQYLFTTTPNQQITLLIYLSQDATTPYNYIGYPSLPNYIIPQISLNDALVYSSILYTCPESTNLGLTPANTNLQMLTAVSQAQTWHRMNTSLIGDTVQIGFALSDAQMFSLDPNGLPLTITGATNADPCVLTVNGQVAINQLCYITGVNGMTQLNTGDLSKPLYFLIIESTATTLTLDVDSTAFGVFTASPQALLQVVTPQNQFAEIELHGCILDVTPSQVLA